MEIKLLAYLEGRTKSLKQRNKSNALSERVKVCIENGMLWAIYFMSILNLRDSLYFRTSITNHQNVSSCFRLVSEYTQIFLHIIVEIIIELVHLSTFRK